MSSESLLEAKSYTDGSWHRLHPLTPVLRAGLAVLAVIGVVFAIVWETFLDSLAHYLIFREFPENPQSTCLTFLLWTLLGERQHWRLVRLSEGLFGCGCRGLFTGFE